MSDVGVGVAAVPVCAAVLCAGVAAWLSGGRSGDVRRARLLLVGAEGAGPEGWAREPAPDEGEFTPRRVLRQVVHWVTWAAYRASRRGGGRWISCRGPRRSGESRHGITGFPRELWCLPAGVVLGVMAGSVLPVIAAVVASVLVRRWLRARERVRERERRGAAVIELCEAVAGELRAGRQPGQALTAAGAAGFGEAGAAVTAAARFGGDVPAALRAAGRLPGAEGLAGVAACWQVAVDGGAGLAAGLERIATALRAERDQRDDLRAQLAGPRATALMLALLPAGGLAMGSALGADPLGVLLHTPAGWACLLAGGLLEGCGIVWTARIIATAEGGGHVR
ncbi:type II secretion system F family protein [Streptomyces paromomycinus]|uniref:Membrane protein n=1 Tax=Streptomyces paromomycinus TaxID=92743 RepID=A0A401W3Z6_STREY|nr:type II secretion system F family protein [Streptomyces paromomycinus]GCD44040.1 membrane protein [Streptomyces paromomycinus]